jgi:RNA polymerase sigma factor (sigma-70 family)
VCKNDENLLGEKLDRLKNKNSNLPPYVKKDLKKNIEKYKRLILRMAQKYVRNRVEFEDLIQEALIGLVLADRDFDPSRSRNFHTYAIYRMKGKMYEYCIGNESPIYIPTHIAKAASYVRQIQSLLSKEAALQEDKNLMLEIVLAQTHEGEVKLTPRRQAQLRELKRKLGNIAKNSDTSYERLARMAHDSISSIVSDDILGKLPKESDEMETIIGNQEFKKQLYGVLGEKKFTVLCLRYQGWNFREIAEKLKLLGYTNRAGECISKQAAKAILDEAIIVVKRLKLL